MSIDGNMAMIDNYLDGLDAQREADEKLLFNFFGGDYELFKEENEELNEF